MILTIITFIIILGLLVFVHELGHFVTAKRAGIKVEEFGFGFPPRFIGVYKYNDKWRVVGAKNKEVPTTIYSLNFLPLGGFVKIKGEQGERAYDSDSFASKSPGRRIWVLSSGVLMNVVLAVFLLSFGFLIGLPQLIEDKNIPQAKIRDEKIQVIEVIDRLPAQRHGVQMGDTLVSIDSITFKEIKNIQDYIDGKIDQELEVSISRGDEVITQKMTPEINPETGRAGIGVALVKTGLVSYPWYLAIWQGFLATMFLIKAIVVAFYELIRNLIISRDVVVDVAGPVGIAVLTGQVAKLGFIYVLQFTALLSLNLAIINFAPFPALDGGRVLFIIIEKIRGKAVNQKIENVAHNLGFALLMLLILFVTFRDVSKISSKFINFLDYIKGIF